MSLFSTKKSMKLIRLIISRNKQRVGPKVRKRTVGVAVGVAVGVFVGVSVGVWVGEPENRNPKQQKERESKRTNDHYSCDGLVSYQLASVSGWLLEY